MNINVLNKSLDSLNQDITSVVGSYSFNFPTGASGFPVASFNEKFDDPLASGVGGSGQVLASSIPLYNLCDDKNTNLISGSGFFDGETVLEVGTVFNNESYTVFVEYESDDFTGNHDVSRVLFSTMSGVGDASGVNMGLNGANKPYIEYVDSDGNLRTVTSYSELGKRNILSFSRNSTANTFDIGFYDTFYGENTKVETFFTPKAFSGTVDKSFSDNFFVGDFYETGQAGYTGFSGYINDVIIFNEPLAVSQQKSFAQMMIASDVSGKRTEVLTNIVSGITGELIFTSGVTGSGITGFQEIFSGLLEQRCGPDIELFTQSGVVGPLSGELYEFRTGIGEITGFTEISHPGQIFIDEERKSEFRRENLIFTKDYFESGVDSIEIYAYSGEDSDIGKEAFLNLAEQSFDLETGHSGGRDFLFYRNGFLRRSGIFNLTTKEIQGGSWILSGSNKIKTKDTVNSNNFNDTNHYDYVSGERLFIDYVSGQTITSYPPFEYPSYINKDLYFMGQKMSSGASGSYYYLDNGGGNFTLTLNASRIPESGQISIVPRKEFNERITGLSGQLFNYSDKFGNEMAWFNGQRQKRGKDYLIISENSLLSTGHYVQKNDESFLYNAVNEGLNVSY
tara:strand:+ start:9708 stop:11573 length:1866 start_codon:yes stop_codon:yes gene_type:complete